MFPQQERTKLLCFHVFATVEQMTIASNITTLHVSKLFKNFSPWSKQIFNQVIISQTILLRGAYTMGPGKALPTIMLVLTTPYPHQE